MALMQFSQQEANLREAEALLVEIKKQREELDVPLPEDLVTEKTED